MKGTRLHIYYIYNLEEGPPFGGGGLIAGCLVFENPKARCGDHVHVHGELTNMATFGSKRAGRCSIWLARTAHTSIMSQCGLARGDALAHASDKMWSSAPCWKCCSSSLAPNVVTNTALFLQHPPFSNLLRRLCLGTPPAWF